MPDIPGRLEPGQTDQLGHTDRHTAPYRPGWDPTDQTQGPMAVNSAPGVPADARRGQKVRVARPQVTASGANSHNIDRLVNRAAAIS